MCNSLSVIKNRDFFVMQFLKGQTINREKNESFMKFWTKKMIFYWAITETKTKKNWKMVNSPRNCRRFFFQFTFLWILFFLHAMSMTQARRPKILLDIFECCFFTYFLHVAEKTWHTFLTKMEQSTVLWSTFFSCRKKPFFMNRNVVCFLKPLLW